MLNHEQPAPFVIVGDTPGGALTVPTTSARVAARAARQLTEHCPHTQATWQANPHAGPGPVAGSSVRLRPAPGRRTPAPPGHPRLPAHSRRGAATGMGRTVRPPDRAPRVRGPRSGPGPTLPRLPPTVGHRPPAAHRPARPRTRHAPASTTAPPTPGQRRKLLTAGSDRKLRLGLARPGKFGLGTGPCLGSTLSVQ